MTQKLLCWIFSIVYQKWLYNDHHQNHDKVEKVFGWRTARVVTSSGRKRRMSPCFWWFQ